MRLLNIRNKTLDEFFKIQLRSEHDTEISDLAVQEVSKETQHELFMFEEHIKVILSSVIGVSFILGFMYRALLLKNVWQDGICSRPINIMTGKKSLDISKLFSSLDIHVGLADWIKHPPLMLLVGGFEPSF